MRIKQMKQTNNFTSRSVLGLAILITMMWCGAAAFAQTTAFTYQGRFTDSTAAPPTNGTYDFQFALYDAGGTLIAANSTATTGVTVTNGVFTVQLDFTAAAFPGADRFLEIRVKKPSDSNYTTLSPRQQVASTPYAIRALNASNVETTGGNSVVNSINNSSTNTTINSSRLSADVVRLKPATTQTSTSTDFSAALLDASGTTTDTNNNVLGTSRFRFNFDGGFLLTGNNNFGTIPVEGAGTRLMWYPGKSAFRAGTINGTQWDDANVGSYSTAFGDGARASGNWGFSVGQDTVAANSYSVAMGRYNIASGFVSVALGEFAHTNARQGSFVFADRSYTGGPCDTSTLGTYGTGGAGCAASGGVDTRVSAPWNNSFTVRASGGFHFYINPLQTTGLRLSSLNSGSQGGTLYGSFVWTDRSSDASVMPSSPNQTIFRSSGGFTIYTNAAASSGVTIAAGSGTWSSVSDRNMKENFASVDSREILRKVLKLPITTWNYSSQDASVRHIGAMAQDFKAAFNLGEDDRHISVIDPDGVAFAAIQGLNEELNERTTKLQAENDALKEQLKTQRTQAEAQQEKLIDLEEQLKRQLVLTENLRKSFCTQNPQAEICK